MLALWIVLGVLVLVLLSAGGVGLRRVRSRRSAPGAKPTAAGPAPAPTRPATPSRPGRPPADAPPQAPPGSPQAKPDAVSPAAVPTETAPAGAPAEEAPVSGAPALRAPTGEPGAADTVAGERGPEGAAPAPEAPAGEVPAPAVRPRIGERLGRTRERFAAALRGLRGGGLEEETWELLEEALLGADVGLATTSELLDGLRERVRAGELRDGDAVVGALKAELVRTLDAAGSRELQLAPAPGQPDVWLFVGVNGVGKTTTIGKVARQQVEEGRRVLLAAGDTFRAAAADQLATWAARAEVELVRGAPGGDPGAVVFDAVQRAAARGYDLVLADTAGRLHTKVNLIEELKKIRRVADRGPGRVREVLLVLDATTGQNGLQQARQFLEAVGVTGVVLTKLDGTAKGGVIVPIQRDLGIPVKLVGIGEGADDLVPFDAEQFVEGLFAGVDLA
ncbi:signal recognition particle-docking protein FtsY [Aciditerrimonas ferrireducens]|uniref:signal recognition particle-docking protein FtsY n=1 Tax=Aciditerrimonas ferrireducens TaxID=667306 RepID=UPI0020050E93|nr:signal recognition particle-docking protein FtsY [Aciditerrimonas ferrireducens]MCK4177943.1 signal recognition particle-docking protein FtsY [Aciditerrimonas ferrireducens]